MEYATNHLQYPTNATQSLVNEQIIGKICIVKSRVLIQLILKNLSIMNYLFTCSEKHNPLNGVLMALQSKLENNKLKSTKTLLMLFALFFIGNFVSAQAPFITEWKTNNPGTSADNQIIIPAVGTFTYTWKHIGSATTGSGTGNNKTTITFSTPGTYEVKMIPSGATPFNRWNHYLENIDKEKLVKVSQWGSVIWNTFVDAFRDTNNLNITATDIPNLTHVTSTMSMFQNSGISTVPNMNLWNMSAIENTTYMFYNAINFNENIGNWDVSNVEDMSAMFFQTNSFNQPIGLWNTSKVEKMNSLFTNSAFNQNIGSWNVSKVKDMRNIFSSGVFNQNIGAWDVSSVENMGYMFSFNPAFNQDISSWNTAKTVDMDGMFHKNPVFNQNIGNWNVKNVTQMGNMFNEAKAFNQDLSNWDTQNVSQMHQMFNEATAFDQNLGNWNLANLTSASNMFSFSGLSCINYSKTLKGWANKPNTPSGIDIGAHQITYSPEVVNDRNHLKNNLNWNIVADALGTCLLATAPADFTNLKLFPNPVIDYLTIIGLDGKETLTVYDTTGRLLQTSKATGKELKLNFSTYAKGMYLVSITSEKGSTTKKIMKQ